MKVIILYLILFSSGTWAATCQEGFVKRFVRSAKSASSKLIYLRYRALSKLNFERILRGADLYKEDLRGANLSGMSFREMDLSGLDFRWAVLVKADFTGAILVKADFTGAQLNGANFSGAVLYGAKFTKEQAKVLKSQGLSAKISGFVIVE